MKKGEMSMSMIIGAVIAIIILAIIVFLVARSAGGTNRATDCPSKGGICTDRVCSKPIITADGTNVNCPNMGEVCCSVTAIQ